LGGSSAASGRVGRAGWRVALADLRGRVPEFLGDPVRARTAALLPHLLAIGASVALPPLDPGELDAVFGMLVELIPAVSASGIDSGDGSGA
jgi:hypothetical protein